MANGASPKGGWHTTLRVGAFLAWRDLKRANKWTTALIVAVMVLTFLNLVVVSGILVGLIEGSVQAVTERFLGDVFISARKQRPYIDRTTDITSIVRNTAGVEGVTVRYTQGGVLEANWKVSRRPTDLPEQVPTTIAGIDPAEESRLSHMSEKIVEGSFLEPDDFDEVVLGAMLLDRYAGFESEVFPVLKDVQVGDTIRVTIGDVSREVRVKGVVRTKVDEIDRRVFFPTSQFRGLIGRTDLNADEIAVMVAPGTDPYAVKAALIANGVDQHAKVQVAEEAFPKFLVDIKQTFAMLGTFFSSIGLVVACITIFIIIYVNAITRRRFIGILKGIGIHERAIEVSYVLQSLMYSAAGMLIGSFIVFLLLKPYFAAHPINFPFSDGILVATPAGALGRAAVLMFATMVAGYIPARLVAKQNTLDAILGR